MTGHGRGASRAAQLEVTADITSVNRKALEVSVSLPRDYAGAEAFVQERVRAALARGKVTLRIEVGGPETARTQAWDEAALLASLGRLRALAEKASIPFQPDARLLWEMAVAHRQDASSAAPELVQPAIDAAVDAALAELKTMRAREGAALAADLAARLAQLERGLAQMEPELARVPAVQREQLLGRLRQAGLELKVEDERVLRELALFADRCDVSEEVTRLRSHFSQFTTYLASSEPVGRKLEFLLQEIGREFNTLGSKTPSIAATRTVVECKNELERIREQVANVE